jgi:hypothetical protein
MDLFIVEVLLATVLLRFMMVGALAYLLMGRTSVCPHCGTNTAQVRHGWLALLPRVERRFCLECGWTGFVRKTAPVSQPVLPPVAPK